jgi:DNA-binding transcriptional LysR family regulator
VPHTAELFEHGGLIVRDEHPVADVLRRVCHDAGFEPRIAFAANDYQETQGMVAAGIGIALAPQLALSALRPDIIAIPLADSPTRRILLAHLANRRLSLNPPVRRGG